MLDAKRKNGKLLPYGYLLTKVFKFFKVKLGKRKSRGNKCIYNRATFPRMQFVEIGEVRKSIRACIEEQIKSSSTMKRYKEIHHEKVQRD